MVSCGRWNGRNVQHKRHADNAEGDDERRSTTQTMISKPLPAAKPGTLAAVLPFIDEPYRHVLKLRYVHGMSAEAIARLHLLPVEGVEQDLIRGMRLWYLVAMLPQRKPEMLDLKHTDVSVYLRAVDLVLDKGEVSTALLQRRLKIGWFCATRILDQMHVDGIVGPPNGGKERKILMGLHKSAPTDTSTSTIVE